MTSIGCQEYNDSSNVLSMKSNILELIKGQTGTKEKCDYYQG